MGDGVGFAESSEKEFPGWIVVRGKGKMCVISTSIIPYWETGNLKGDLESLCNF